MTAGEKQAMRIGLIGVLVPVVSGVLFVLLQKALNDSTVMSWTFGGLLLVAGIIAGSILLFRLSVPLLKKVLLIVGNLIFSVFVFFYTAIVMLCSVYGDCF